jgi:predicted ATPase
MALFVQRAQSVNSGFSLNNENVEAVTELCQRLDGLPLAIELAAYQIKYFSPQAMLVSLCKNRLDFLGQDPQRMPPHQQTIRAMLDWSFHLLPPELQDCFCAVAVFPGRFTISDAEAVVAREDLQAGLIALVDHSLLEQQPCADDQLCFQMMSIIREYALEKQKR